VSVLCLIDVVEIAAALVMPDVVSLLYVVTFFVMESCHEVRLGEVESTSHKPPQGSLHTSRTSPSTTSVP